jgi:membrane-associated phospholipid phosphatase
LLAGSVYIGVKKKIFTDMDVSKREQRPLLFFLSIVCSTLYLLTLFALQAPYLLIIVTSGVILGIIVLSIINRHVKASIHVATLMSLVLTIALGYGGYWYLLLLLVPLVGWARLRTKRHTLTETIAGGILGIFLSTTVYAAYQTVKVLLPK